MPWIAVALALLFVVFAGRRQASPAARVGWQATLVAVVSLLLATRLGGSVLLVAGPVLAGLAWRWLQAGGAGPARASRVDDTTRSHGSMTRRDALRVLGLTESADDAAITRAHRNLIKKVHSDQGGSDFLAQQVNEAKRVLDTVAR